MGDIDDLNYATVEYAISRPIEEFSQVVRCLDYDASYSLSMIVYVVIWHFAI